VIDLHCHVLWGIDDGPKTIEASLGLARAAAAHGTRTLVATPHVSRPFPNDPATIRRLVEELRERLAEEGPEIELVAGAEIAITRLVDIEPTELGRLTLGSSPWLLIEPPFTPVATNIDTIVLELQDRGHRIVLAHPERCPAFHRNPAMLESLVGAGVLTSITAGSLVGRFGEAPRRFALDLARHELLHNVASDAHDHLHRPPHIAEELTRAGLGPIGPWLTGSVPAAILAAQEIPPRPAVALPALAETRRAWWPHRH
jgi:protein-tyrosine phosphatase